MMDSRKYINWNSFMHFILHRLKIHDIELLLLCIVIHFCRVSFSFYIHRHIPIPMFFISLCISTLLPLGSFPSA